MKNKLPILTVFLILVALAGMAHSSALAEEAMRERFLPHRAVYALSLDQERASGIVVGANGGFDYEWADVCDGWAIRHEAEIFFEMSQGVDLQTGWKVSTWESKAGDSLRYFVRRFENGHQRESVRGTASLNEKSGFARFKEPAGETVKLPSGVYFPSAHSFEMMERLSTPGDSFFAMLFDGSSPEEGLTSISAIAQGEVEMGPDPELPLPELFAGKTGLSVALAYFLSEEQGAEPISEQQVVYFDNGIVTEVVFDFGDIAIKGELVDLEILEDPGC